MRPNLLALGLLAAACATVEATPQKSPPAEASAAAAPTTPAAAPAATPAPAAPAESPPVLQLPAHTRPLSYALELTLVTSHDGFTGREDIEVELGEPRQVIWLHGRGLHVTQAIAGDVVGKYEQVNPEGLAKLTFDKPLPKGKVRLHLAWDAPWDPQLSGLYLTKEDGESYVGSQFETHFARRAFPCFDDPQFKTPFDLTLVVDAKHVAVSNTNRASEKPLDGGLKQVSFARTPPLPTYLLDFSVGPFDVVAPPPLPPNDVRNHPLQVRGLAPKGRGPELAFALQAGGELLVELEHYFGIPFPYEKLDHIAVPDNFGGAMENAGAITYVDSALLFNEGVSSEEARTGIAAVMAHEMAHQWFGDLVTMRWWTDIWLNESFAEWMAVRVVEGWKPGLQLKVQHLAETHRAMHDDSLVSSRAVRHPLEKMEEVGDQFDNLTYQKGSAVLAMFEQWLGPETFRTGVHDYLLAHANGSGSTEELLASLAHASGKPVAPAFHSFLDQAGVPLVQVKVSCEPKAAKLSLSQSRWLPVGSAADAKRTWQVPFCARFGAGKSSTSACTLLDGASGTLAIPGGACPDWVLPNPNAEGYYRWALEPKQLAQLKAKGKLTVAEKLSLFSNLNSALRSGTVLFADAAPVLEWLAQDSDGEVAGQYSGLLSWVYRNGVDAALQPKVAAYAERLYRPRLAKVGWKPAPKEPPSARRLRTELVDLLALEFDDAATLKQASQLGHAYAGADGNFHSDAVSPDLAGVVLASAVRADPKLYGALVDRLGTLKDGELRQRILGAVSSTEDPATSDQVLGLWKDARLRQSELPWALFGQLQQPKVRERAWKSFQADFDALMPRLEPMFRGYSPQVMAGFCDEAHAKEVDAFFRPRLEKFPEMRLSLEHALEEIRECVAVQQAQKASVTAFFQKAR